MITIYLECLIANVTQPEKGSGLGVKGKAGTPVELSAFAEDVNGDVEKLPHKIVIE